MAMDLPFAELLEQFAFGVVETQRILDRGLEARAAGARDLAESRKLLESTLGSVADACVATRVELGQQQLEMSVLLRRDRHRSLNAEILNLGFEARYAQAAARASRVCVSVERVPWRGDHPVATGSDDPVEEAASSNENRDNGVGPVGD